MCRVCQGYSGQKGPRGFPGDDGEPVWKASYVLTYSLHDIMY